MGKGKIVVIIGCGIGGSAEGALLARDGFQVEIFEKISFIGGRFASQTGPQRFLKWARVF